MNWTSAITAYFHYFGFMVSFAALGVELFHFKPEMSLTEAKRVAFADVVYGISATTILVTGILRVMYFGKGSEYYLHNPFFWTKMGIFIVVSLLSLYPTVTFISWFKTLREEKPPTLELSQVNRIAWMIKGELFGFIFIPLFAAIMARMT
jgi:putative membrane protein